MDTISYKATNTLDKNSLKSIEYLAKYWDISKAEVVRRCVRVTTQRAN